MKVKRHYPEIYRALENTGLGWSIENGGRHLKILLGGRFCGILPKAKSSLGDKRAMKNIVAQIRRTSRDLKSKKEKRR